MKKKMKYLFLLLTTIFIVGCTTVEDTSTTNEVTGQQEVSTVTTNENNKETNVNVVEEPAVKEEEKEELVEEEVETVTTVINEPTKEKTQTKSTNDLFSEYKRIEVNACDLSGHRQSNVVVDIGYGEREYLAFTNEHGQLVRVLADEIILQNDRNESVKSNGRYCSDEAKVPGVESDNLDEGHIIADSLGGVSNAYNITPQESTLNRHGDQAYMERVIRDAGGATNFEAIITYPNTKTQIPSSYQYTYTIRGNTVVDTFDNVNPDEVNKSLGLTDNEATKPTEPAAPSTNGGDISSVDTNGNGKVTIKEAKDAGFKMPITRDHWLYQYMDDRDGDGLVGE